MTHRKGDCDSFKTLFSCRIALLVSHLRASPVKVLLGIVEFTNELGLNKGQGR